MARASRVHGIRRRYAVREDRSPGGLRDGSFRMEGIPDGATRITGHEPTLWGVIQPSRGSLQECLTELRIGPYFQIACAIPTGRNVIRDGI